MEPNRDYNGNAAYDFDMFVTKPKKHSAEIVDYPSSDTKRKVRAERKARSIGQKLAIAALTITIVGGVFANVFARAEISQVQMQIDKQKKAISTLDSEIVRLQCGLQQKMTYDSLEEGAAALGMQKLERRQITYIPMNDEATEEETK